MRVPIKKVKSGVSCTKVGISDKPMRKVLCNQKEIDTCLNCTKPKCKIGECEKIKNKGDI